MLYFASCKVAKMREKLAKVREQVKSKILILFSNPQLYCGCFQVIAQRQEAILPLVGFLSINYLVLDSFPE